MNAFKYDQPKINTTDPNKWYIGYNLFYDDGTKERRREHGLKNYKISLTKEKDLDQRMKLAKRLLRLVEDDLSNDIDPNKRNEELDKRNLERIKAQQKELDLRISFDDALMMVKREKGWINPAEGKEHTANIVPTSLTSTFKPFLKRIGKIDDIREVTRIDVKNYIEERFNPIEGKGWSSASCSAAKARVSILFGVLLDKDLITHNPAVGIKIKKDNEKIVPVDIDDIDRFDPWTAEETQHWFEDLSVAETETEKLMYVSSALLYFAFIRKSELLRLKWWMVNFERNCLTLPPRITKSARKYNTKKLIDVQLTPTLFKILKDWKDERFFNGANNDDYLFPNPKNGTQYKYVTFTKQFGQLRSKFQKTYKGLYKGKNQYALKHSGVINMFMKLIKTDDTQAKISLTIQTQCRHSDWSQTAVYLRKLNLEFESEAIILDY